MAFRVRMLISAEKDSGYPYFEPESDIQQLLLFVERLQKLGWLPPNDARAVELCTAFGTRPHCVMGTLFYEFCLSGLRNERSPWLTVFFHIEASTGTIRICGVEKTLLIRRYRKETLEKVRIRVKHLVECQDRRFR